MDYAEIISNLDTDSVIHLMTELGADRYEDKGGILSTTPPDLCNIRLYTLENPPFISFNNLKLFLIQA